MSPVLDPVPDPESPPLQGPAVAGPGTLAERVLAQLEHLRVDEESDQLLELFVTAWMSGLERAGLIAYGDGSSEPGDAITDPAVAPLWALPHAAMWTGGTVPPRIAGESDDEYLARARSAVVFPRGMRRGSRSAITVAAEPLLTDSKSVVVIERAGGDLYATTIRTRESETSDPELVAREVIGGVYSSDPVGVVAAGIVVTYVVSDAPLIDEGTAVINDVNVPINTATLADVT